MTDATPPAGGLQGYGKIALIRACAVAAGLSGSAAACAVGLGAGAPAVTLVALLALIAMAIGYLFGRPVKATRLLMVRVADELAQYRAFTRLLRDQGARIVESTAGAATMIVAGLNEMDVTLDRMRILSDRVISDDAAELRALVEAAGAPVVAMLGHLQFQDVTQQQITFLSRLSLVLDDHMVRLSRQLGDRRAMDRVGSFKDMFDEALGDCVMEGQRDDHHAASGLGMREAASSKVEMFL
jgi:hypothetical protein